MKVLVIDTSVCIDLWKGGLLEALGKLRAQVLIPDIVLEELLRPDHSLVEQSGVSTVSISAKGITRAVTLAAQFRQESRVDVYCLVASEEASGILVTGDRSLAQAARALGLETHGVLWLMDRLVQEHVVGPDQALLGLQNMLAQGCWLPKHECDLRIEEWRGLHGGGEQGTDH